MLLRRAAVFLGLVLAIVGVVGLASPVSVSPGLQPVRCGTVIAPEPTEADRPPGSELRNADFDQLCRAELTDRRQWTTACLVVGLAVAIGAGLLILRARRSPARPADA